MDDKSKLISLLELYFDEWKFRQETLWRRIVQFVIIIFFVSTFPITIGVFEGIVIPKLPLIIFPIISIVLSLFFLLFCLSESSRINATDRKIQSIIQEVFPGYEKNKLMPFMDRNIGKKEAFFMFRWKMAIWVPSSLSLMQIALAIFVIVLISTGLLK